MGFGNYTLMVHEAGHALGLSKFDYSNFIDTWGNPSYDVAHPTIPESVVNYDSEARRRAGWIMSNYPNYVEPDCSPHPFDVLAIYALYQNVPLRSFP